MKRLLLTLALGPMLWAQAHSQTFNATGACLGDTVQFVPVGTTGALNFYWQFGDGSDTWEIESPRYFYAQAGTYTVSMTVYFPEGSQTVSKDITIEPAPAIAIAYDGPTSFLQGGSVGLEATAGFAGYLWSTGEGTAAIVVSQGGFYSVVGTTASGCQATATSQEIRVLQAQVAPIEIVANILTPNGDGINDRFEIQDLDAFGFPCQVLIFNQWGREVYSSADYQADTPWDGYLEGKLLDAGAYFFILRTEDRPQATGTINLLR